MGGGGGGGHGRPPRARWDLGRGGEVDGWRTRVSCRRVLPRGEPLVAFVFVLAWEDAAEFLTPLGFVRHATAVALWRR